MKMFIEKLLVVFSSLMTVSARFCFAAVVFIVVVCSLCELLVFSDISAGVIHNRGY